MQQLSRNFSLKELRFTKNELSSILTRYGLPHNIASIFIKSVTFGRLSRDLFDHPLIKHSDGHYLVFRPAVISAQIATIVLSTISQIGEKLQKKGKSFEKEVAELFSSNGLKTYSLKTTIDKEQYEFDIILPWGDYLFMFECKNRMLPMGSPQQIYNFETENMSNVKQTKRLAKAINDHPTIIKKYIAEYTKEKTIVPVVLNCLPYSIPDGIDNIYFYEYPALRRFFDGSKITLHTFDQNGQIKPLKVICQLWQGDKPTPEDLFNQIRRSAQFTLIEESLAIDNSGFPLSQEWWVKDYDTFRNDHPEARTQNTEI